MRYAIEWSPSSGGEGLPVRRRSADLKISKSALLSLNHQNFSNNEPIYTKYSFMESLLNYLAFEFKMKMVDLLPWQQQIIDSQQKI